MICGVDLTPYPVDKLQDAGTQILENTVLAPVM